MPYADPEKAKQHRKQYYEANKHKWKDETGAWKATQTPQRRSECQLAYYYRNRETISQKRKVKTQEKAVYGTCPICCTEQQRLVYDHCHKSGIHRGYICSHCNLMLGHSKDSPQSLLRAVLYLLEAEKMTEES